MRSTDSQTQGGAEDPRHIPRGRHKENALLQASEHLLSGGFTRWSAFFSILACGSLRRSPSRKKTWIWTISPSKCSARAANTGSCRFPLSCGRRFGNGCKGHLEASTVFSFQRETTPRSRCGISRENSRHSGRDWRSRVFGCRRIPAVIRLPANTSGGAGIWNSFGGFWATVRSSPPKNTSGVWACRIFKPSMIASPHWHRSI